MRRPRWSAGAPITAVTLLLGAGLLTAACERGGPPLGRETTTPAPVVATPIAGAAKDLFPFSTRGWRTDFSRHSVPLSEILPGGPPRDGIPPIDAPKFLPVAAGDGFLRDTEPMIALVLNGDARAYPIRILIWHEIVNDTVGGVPVAVTFCPLCNIAIVFDRRVEGQVLDFGTTGNLRHSDLVMWDRQTESWWQQATGEAIVGALTGKRLAFLPAAIVAWRDFKAAYPRGVVLSQETGHERPYGINPYVGYDEADQPPFLFKGSPDGRLLPKERVVTVSLNGEDVAYPFSVLQRLRVVNDTVGGTPIVVVWQPGTASPLDAEVLRESRDVGAAAVYHAVLDGRYLIFRTEGDTFVDAETASRWTLLGQAVAGPLAGRQLEPVVHGNHFWFSWAVFKPHTRIYRAP